MKKIIFDTDIGGDCDDVMALDLLLSADRHKECVLLGVTYSSDNEYAPSCIYAILQQHGEAGIPIGKAYFDPTAKKHADNYSKPVAEAFPYADAPKIEDLPYAATVLRKLLTENDHVTLVVTGFLTNLAALIRSESDTVSPLNGIELMKKSIDEIVLMGCCFSHINCINPVKRAVSRDGAITPITEYNIVCDLEAAQYTFKNCPVPITCCPFEVGLGMLTGKPMCEFGNGHTPDSLAYTVFGATDGRDSWDPATALYGIYGAQPFFYKSSPGTISIDKDGISQFCPSNGGLHTILQCAKPTEEIARRIDSLVMRLFGISED